MRKTLDRLRSHRDDTETDGFTMIEILIVIIVLGILAAVVLFALGGITGKSAIAACQADGSTVSSAISSLEAQYPGTPLTSTGLVSSALGGPYLQSWPNNSAHYSFTVSGTTPSGLQLTLPGGSPFTYAGPTSCQGVS